MNTDAAPDPRRQALDAWVAAYLGESVAAVPVSSDASFRRYFRYRLYERSLIAMDAPTETEDCRPFIAIAQQLANCGLCVPQVLAQDLEQGFLLLSDLGDSTYVDTINPDNADALFGDAINVMIRFQKLADASMLAKYDEAMLRRELELFPEWYLKTHLDLPIDTALRALLDELFNTLIKQILSQATVFVHRDYMPRNLMVCSANNPGVLDFQDAVLGPVSYDPICLFKDAFLSWPEPKVQQWLQQYWQQAVDAGLPVPASFAQFQFDCDFMGVQRHLKVIGIFARICHRDGKPRYVQDIPRFFEYLRVVAGRRPELGLLLQLLDELASRQDQTS